MSDSKEDIEKWIMERKKRYPTRARIDARNGEGDNSGGVSESDRKASLIAILKKQEEMGLQVGANDEELNALWQRTKMRRDGASGRAKGASSCKSSLLNKLLNSDMERQRSWMIQAVRLITDNEFLANTENPILPDWLKGDEEEEDHETAGGGDDGDDHAEQADPSIIEEQPERMEEEGEGGMRLLVTARV